MGMCLNIIPLLTAISNSAAGDNASAMAETTASVFAPFAAFFGMMGVFSLFYCFALLIGLASFVIWIWALVDCLSRKDYDSENEKLLWALVIIFAGIIGAAIYYFLVKRKKDTEKKPESVKKEEPKG